MQTFTLKEHFFELKNRAFIVFFAFVIAFTICYYFSDNIYNFLLKPLAVLNPENYRKVIYTGLTEAFFTYLKLAAFSAFTLIIPILTIQIFLFLKPGLHKKEQQIAAIILCMSPILFWTGAIFVFYYVMPKAWHFFLSFEKTSISIPIILEAKISEYLDLIIHLIIAFGLAFQLPIIIILLNLLKVVDTKSLKKKRRLSIVINFLISGILTPPDVISQFALAIPLLLLYEISIILCKFVEDRGYNVRH